MLVPVAEIGVPATASGGDCGTRRTRVGIIKVLVANHRKRDPSIEAPSGGIIVLIPTFGVAYRGTPVIAIKVCVWKNVVIIFQIIFTTEIFSVTI